MRGAAQVRRIAAVLVLLGAVGARAGNARGNPAYAVTATIRFAPDALEFCRLDGHDATPARPSRCSAAVGQELRRSFEEAARRMFAAPEAGKSADLLLDVAIDDAYLDKLYGFPQALISARVGITTAEGPELATVRAEGTSPAPDETEDALVRAYSRAAAGAAENFDRAFANSEPVATWLVARKITPVHSNILGPGRGDVVLFFDAGGGATGTSDGLGNDVLARLGISGRWFVAQAIVAHWTSGAGEGDGVTATAFGVEAGPALRLGRIWEVRAGAGLQTVSGSLDTSRSVQYLTPRRDSVDFSRITPTLFGAVQYAWWPRWSGASRFRFGLEARQALDSGAPFEQVRAVLPVAGLSFAFFVGIELPVVQSSLPPLL